MPVKHIPLSLALATQDAQIAAALSGRRFSLGTRPLIRWNRTEAMNDALAQTAVGLATRLFGSEVDYCLHTIGGIEAARARTMLAWAEQPVEWWPDTGFAQRLRPGAPEWVISGEVVLGAKPVWFDEWCQGVEPLRLTHGPAVAPADDRFLPGIAQAFKLPRLPADELDRCRWLGASGQWGIPGWSTNDVHARVLLHLAKKFVDKPVLELGTSRGRLSAMLALCGCQVTTVDHQDRGAAANLAGLPVHVVQDDAVHFLTHSPQSFDLIVVDLHGNTVADWQRYATGVLARLACGGTLVLNNLMLGDMPEWHGENGVRWFLSQLPSHWRIETQTHTPPGMAVVTSMSKPPTP